MIGSIFAKIKNEDASTELINRFIRKINDLENIDFDYYKKLA
jgi:hypothetical protein